MPAAGRWRPPEAPTYSVSDLGAEIKDLLAEAYSSVWVAGEIHRARSSARGHLYFELVEKGGGDAIVGKVDAVVWRTDHLRIARLLRGGGQRLAEGQEIRCRVQVDFYPPMGRLQVVVREVDPLFTLGSLARRRSETLAALDAAGLLDQNRARHLSRVPLDVALITSPDSAAFHDFASGLAESGYGFRVLLIPAAVQGVGAERALAAAFAQVAACVRDGIPLDTVVVTRGGGARTDLAVFDSRAVAEAAARCPVPVLSGLGHETDEAVVDRVAHTALKTPTQVAAFLVERVRDAETDMLTLQAAVVGAASERLDAARARLARVGIVARTARSRLASARARVHHAGHALSLLSGQRLRQASARLETTARRLRDVPAVALERARPRPEAVTREIAMRAGRQLRMVSDKLDGLARLCTQASPERVLARGFSITRDPRGGVVRQASRVATGDAVTIQVADGTIVSTVLGTENQDQRVPPNHDQEKP